MDDKVIHKVSANYEILMDYYKAHADELTPQPIIRDVNVTFKGKYNTLSLGFVSLKFIYVTPSYIELRVMSLFGDRFTILVLKADDTSTLEVEY